jgi:hypothetical protein
MAYETELTALAATPTVLRRLLVAGWESRPAGDEGWTATEVVAHLRDCEEYRLLRCRRMRDEDQPFLEAFDQEALALERDYKSANQQATLDAFERVRGDVIALLSALDETAWRRRGRHEELGTMTIEDQARQAVAHDLLHLGQIAESLRAPAR